MKTDEPGATAPDFPKRYAARVNAVLRTLSEVCPECGETPAITCDSDHVLDESGTYVLVGCEGYLVVDPNALGFDMPNWQPQESNAAICAREGHWVVETFDGGVLCERCGAPASEEEG